MTLYEFNLLDDEEEKIAAVLHNGEFVASRKDPAGDIMLYQLPNFYVEVSRTKEKEKILRFRSFSTLEPLKPYLEEIDISDIINP